MTVAVIVCWDEQIIMQYDNIFSASNIIYSSNDIKIFFYGVSLPVNFGNHCYSTPSL